MRFQSPQVISLLALTHSASSMGFSLDPYNKYDSFYEQNVRCDLAKFHVNLSNGKYSANGPLVSLPMQWNVNGQLLIGRQNFIDHLALFNVSFNGLQVPDMYHIVDGNVGAVLYHLQGHQTGPFNSIPSQGKRLEIMGGELMIFDGDALLDNLYTVEELGLALAQITGTVNVTGPDPNVSVSANPQTSPQFRTLLRANMAKVHRNFNAGQNQKNAELVTSDVQINANYLISTGSSDFVGLVASWQSAFPDMVIRDDYILADGHQGAIEYVWEGSQTGAYKSTNGTTLPPNGKTVRVRGFMFLEFDDEGLINKVTSVHDEAVIAEQLQSGILYP